MEINPGAKLGPFEIVGMPGKGGMGEVRRARDPRLGPDTLFLNAHSRLQAGKPE